MSYELTDGTQGLIFNEPLLFEQGSEGREGCTLPDCDVPEKGISNLIPEDMVRDEISGFPSLSEVDVVRHFTRLSQWNYSVDLGFYPLGSCTMKYNPKINEDVARLSGFSNIHPYQPEELSQGALQMMFELGEYLSEIGGMDRVFLQPSAGAHGELAGMMIIKAYHESKGENRHKVIIPDSAHGTNPASSTLCGYKVIEFKSNGRGLLDPEAVEKAMDTDVAAFMITNPNTLGLFEENILEITEIVHRKGGLIYCDGANLNAIMGIARPGDMGVDVLHFNLHKTFSTPHGGGGPGAGPVGIKRELIPFMPVPVIEKNNVGQYKLNYNFPHSIGRVKAFYGNFGILVRAYTYIRTMGAEGLKMASETAVLNANYIMNQLKDYYYLPYDRRCMHESVFSDKIQSKYGITTLDIAKALIDYGFHPPTIYFPLIVKGAIMIEPTETESKDTMDRFIDAMKDIAVRAEKDPDSLKKSPLKPKVTRLNETKAAREPNLRWVNDYLLGVF
ncbi:MAG: glycine dehydrogenase (aminomethyl-transferring) [Nitrospinae bacterium RIFCSPLOWO2_12_39_16]|nr:MAG: glycine dehydrogenase (aminomethyl-transferring) [Nitrospinae bacterium RIFCSPLOWO2_12_39_16]